MVRADDGLVTLTTDDGAGHIFLRSTSSLDLGAVTTKTGAQTVNIVANSTAGDDIAIEASSNTDDNWTLLADDSIEFVGNVTVSAGSATLTATNGAISADTAATHINTSAVNGAITLTSATGIGSSGQALTVAAAGGVVTATTGNASIYLASTSDLALGEITTAAGTSTVSITANSVAGLDVNIGVTSDTDDNWAVTTSGNIAFVGNVTVSAASASLSAGGAITSGTGTVDLDTHDGNGNITLSATGGIGGCSQPRAACGPTAAW